MFPFPATLHGEPVQVYQLTEDGFANIARADGRRGYVRAPSLVIDMTAVSEGVVVMMASMMRRDMDHGSSPITADTTLRLCPLCGATAYPGADGKPADLCPDCGTGLTDADKHPTLTIGRSAVVGLSAEYTARRGER